MNRLDSYVRSDSNNTFVLAAPGGMGKTTLLANWIDPVTPDRIKGRTGESIHYRFIGQSDQSTNSRQPVALSCGSCRSSRKDPLRPPRPGKLLTMVRRRRGARRDSARSNQASGSLAKVARGSRPAGQDNHGPRCLLNQLESGLSTSVAPFESTRERQVGC